MAQEQGSGGFGLKSQDAVFLGKPHGPGHAGNFRPYNVVPVQDQCGICKTGADKSGMGRSRCVLAHRTGPAAPFGFILLLASAGVFGHGRIMPGPVKKRDTAVKLLAWYDVHRRVLPWRAAKGKKADPYRVWLSEIMLQQTTVQAVGAYYRKFLTRWPNVAALARAKTDDVMAAWAGLGYYARARNLHAAAKIVAGRGGKFPLSAESLSELPGIGSYTAAAIAAIAYDERQAAMDANAERVIARLFAVKTQLPKGKIELRAHAQELVPVRAGDFAQALMDLGSAICTPKKPACGSCPLEKECEARRLGIQEMLPVKAPKMLRPIRRGAAYVVQDKSGAVLLERRPAKGLLGGMLQPPLGPWTNDFPSSVRAKMKAPFVAPWKKQLGIVRHGFTHFELEIEVYAVQLVARPLHPGRWVPVRKLGSMALPTVMRKILDAVLHTNSARKR